jgi:hypothetical protein
MLKLLCLALALVATACDNPFKKDNEDKGSRTSLLEQVRAKDALYKELSLAKIARDLPWGWADESGDAFLFNCLYRAAGGTGDYTLAVAADGQPRRNPDRDPSQDKSPWSKDMEAGFLWCIHTDPDQSRALDQLELHIAYGREHDWDMCGDADVDPVTRLSRCKMSGGLQRVLYLLLKDLGGHCDSECSVEIANPLNYEIPTNGEEFGRHLAMITRHLRGRLTGAVNDFQLDAMESAAREQPENALYQCLYHRYKDGDTTAAAELLLETRFFPADRLPSDADYCTHYLYQRDSERDRELTADESGCLSYHDAKTAEPVSECGLEPGSKHTRHARNPDWLPCGESADRVPVDFLFAAKCVLGE